MSIWYCKRRDVLTGPEACCKECERVEIKLPPPEQHQLWFTEPDPLPTEA